MLRLQTAVRCFLRTWTQHERVGEPLVGLVEIFLRESRETLRHERLEALVRKIEALPDGPGVYIWKDGHDRVIYVGKAKHLRSRVRSYLTGVHTASPKLRMLARSIADLDTMVVPSESQALLLENNLIKEYAPRFNIQLRDDKSYPTIAVTLASILPARRAAAADYWRTPLRTIHGRRYAPPDPAGHPAYLHRAVVPLRTPGRCTGACLPRLPHRPLRGVWAGKRRPRTAR